MDGWWRSAYRDVLHCGHQLLSVSGGHFEGLLLGLDLVDVLLHALLPVFV
jgi:hypothetical protein